ncbi:hypothetical protein ACFOY4_10360 [Actinomadura syzygii]|uniref:hypothetical protein n=1 Tax=Actinomadura syzygii TaxID=1427538 RepID=UPI001CA30CCE|nr:hypothetical protein [Actinomadura syzygii]
MTASAVPGRPFAAPGRRSAMAAAGLFCLAVAEVAVAVSGAVAARMSWAEALDLFVVTNSVIGLSFPVCGVLLAWHRPRNPIGWLLLAAGIGYATTAALAPLIEVGVRDGWPTPLLRALTTVARWSWPWSIGLCLPVVLQLFPDGRPVFRRLLWATVLTAPLFALEMGTEPGPLVGDSPAT